MIPGVDWAVITTAFSVAEQLGATPKVMLSLFEAGIVESGWRNLGNQGADNDHDSLGFLQQRPSQGWPDPMNVPTATKSYVTKALANEKKNPSYSAGQLAQSVQVSAYPDRYDKQEKNARELLTEAAKRKGGGGWWIPLPGGGFGLPPIGGGGTTVDEPGLVDAIQAGADAIKAMSTGVVNVGGLATQLAKLALPTNIIRACAGGLGVVFIFTGVTILGRQIK